MWWERIWDLLLPLPLSPHFSWFCHQSGGLNPDPCWSYVEEKTKKKLRPCLFTEPPLELAGRLFPLLVYQPLNMGNTRLVTNLPLPSTEYWIKFHMEADSASPSCLMSCIHIHSHLPLTCVLILEKRLNFCLEMECEYKNSLLKRWTKKIKSLTKNLEHKMLTHKTSLRSFPVWGNPR